MNETFQEEDDLPSSQRKKPRRRKLWNNKASVVCFSRCSPLSGRGGGGVEWQRENETDRQRRVYTSPRSASASGNCAALLNETRANHLLFHRRPSSQPSHTAPFLSTLTTGGPLEPSILDISCSLLQSGRDGAGGERSRSRNGELLRVEGRRLSAFRSFDNHIENLIC